MSCHRHKFRRSCVCHVHTVVCLTRWELYAIPMISLPTVFVHDSECSHWNWTFQIRIRIFLYNYFSPNEHSILDRVYILISFPTECVRDFMKCWYADKSNRNQQGAVCFRIALKLLLNISRFPIVQGPSTVFVPFTIVATHLWRWRNIESRVAQITFKGKKLRCVVVNAQEFSSLAQGIRSNSVAFRRDCVLLKKRDYLYIYTCICALYIYTCGSHVAFPRDPRSTELVGTEVSGLDTREFHYLKLRMKHLTIANWNSRCFIHQSRK